MSDLAQWRRDAAVAIVPFCDATGAPSDVSFCSGVLVSPRIVLTNAHCVGRRARGVSFSPRNPLVTGTVPPGTPDAVCVRVIGCATHPGAIQTCDDGRPPEVANPDRDLAVLVLGERMDHGQNGLRTQRYPVVPATIVPHDDEIFGIDTPDSWTERRVQHVGYGPVEGCVPGFGPLPSLRQVARQTVEFGNWIINGWSSSIALFGMHGLPGDSGGPVFLEESGPLRVLGIHRGIISIDVLPSCAPEFSLVRDHAVRLTHSSIQGFLATFINATLTESTPGLLWGSGHPAYPVWTGDLDLPPTTEPGRALFPFADTMDPDGDGLVGERDNCWGIANIGQSTSDPAALTATCIDRGAGGIMRTYACVRSSGPVETDIDPDDDRVPDACDNCDGVSNVSQADCDADGIGDACEVHSDSDRIPDDCDNCDTIYNPGQADCDGDGVGDACEADGDEDGVPDDCDNCPADANFLQLNCNLEAELAEEVMPRGDACDPNPCTRSIVESEMHDAGDRLNVLTVVKTEPSGSTGARFRTGFRFCPCSVALDDSPASRERCKTRQPDGSGACNIAAAGDYSGAEQANWRIPTLQASVLDSANEVTLTHDTVASFSHLAEWRVSDLDCPGGRCCSRRSIPTAVRAVCPRPSGAYSGRTRGRRPGAWPCRPGNGLSPTTTGAAPSATTV